MLALSSDRGLNTLVYYINEKYSFTVQASHSNLTNTGFTALYFLIYTRPIRSATFRIHVHSKPILLPNCHADGIISFPRHHKFNFYCIWQPFFFFSSLQLFYISVFLFNLGFFIIKSVIIHLQCVPFYTINYYLINYFNIVKINVFQQQCFSIGFLVSLFWRLPAFLNGS